MGKVKRLMSEYIKGQQVEDPFYVLNVEDIIKKYCQWTKLMPRVKPFFAVKCNSTPMVIELLAALGTGFDCASQAEIDSVLSKGVSPSRIIYANPCKSRSHLTYACDENVELMTFDSEQELYKIAEIFPRSRLVLRIKVDDSHSKYHLSQKYGATVEDSFKMFELARQLGLNIVGVSFHVGSDCKEPHVYSKAIQDSRNVFQIGESFGFKMDLLDIGGGFPGNDSDEDRCLFQSISDVVNSSLSAWFPVSCQVNIIAEPGRYFVASAFSLFAMIIGKRVIKDDTTNRPLSMYYLNDGLYGSFSNTTFGEDEALPVPLLTKQQLLERPVLRTMLWGPTCDSLDCIRKKINLPDMNVGEWFLFRDMGAYTMSIATHFNGFEPPTIKYQITPKAVAYLQTMSTESKFFISSWEKNDPYIHIVNC